MEPGLILRFSSDLPAHRADVGARSDAAARTVAAGPQGVPDHANDAEVVCPRGMAGDLCASSPGRIERSPLMKEVQDLAFGQDQ